MAAERFWHWSWYRQIPFLGRHFRLIALDNRGVGESDKPDEPYTIAQMAADAAALLQALGLERAHVLGTSMGGYIAQELALSHPERVDGLVLVATSPGGPDQVVAPREVLAALQPDPGLSLEENVRRGLAVTAAPGYWEQNPDERAAIIEMRLKRPTPLHSYRRQWQAIKSWPGAGSRLADLEIPALVVHGDEDRLIPVENARRLAQRMPAAELRLLPGAGHLCWIEQAPMFNRVVAEYLHSL